MRAEVVLLSGRLADEGRLALADDGRCCDDAMGRSAVVGRLVVVVVGRLAVVVGRALTLPLPVLALPLLLEGRPAPAALPLLGVLLLGAR